MAEEELEERRSAELEFISAAYDPEEAWWDDKGGIPVVYRRLDLPTEGCRLSVILSLRMVPGYPETEELDIACTVEQQQGNTKNNGLLRVAYKAAPKLIEICREESSLGEESVLLLLSRADEWIEDSWPALLLESDVTEAVTAPISSPPSNSSSTGRQILGRRLIYSHHLISKIKRSDIRGLTSHYKLTGYMKIGWPGIIILEGPEDNCAAFYDQMRRWAWKYLVVRGEQQERVLDLDASRKFEQFIETDDMSRVAQHCRSVGLEALFRTSMKVYDNSGDTEHDDEADELPYGALVYVDHMNDTKGYRKWLRKTAKEVDCFLLLKQSYPNHDFSKRPLIIVGIVGESNLVQQFLKRWRTSRVDVDSKGKPCLERMMTVLMEGELGTSGITAVDWDKAHEEENMNVSREQLLLLVESIGGEVWKAALEDARK